MAPWEQYSGSVAGFGAVVEELQRYFTKKIFKSVCCWPDMGTVKSMLPGVLEARPRLALRQPAVEHLARQRLKCGLEVKESTEGDDSVSIAD
jgi:hypothetical protein